MLSGFESLPPSQIICCKIPNVLTPFTRRLEGECHFECHRDPFLTCSPWPHGHEPHFSSSILIPRSAVFSEEEHQIRSPLPFPDGCSAANAESSTLMRP